MRPIRIMRDSMDTEGVKIALLAVPAAVLLGAGRGPLTATMALVVTVDSEAQERRVLCARFVS